MWGVRAAGRSRQFRTVGCRGATRKRRLAVSFQHLGRYIRYRQPFDFSRSRLKAFLRRKSACRLFRQVSTDCGLGRKRSVGPRISKCCGRHTEGRLPSCYRTPQASLSKRSSGDSDVDTRHSGEIDASRRRRKIGVIEVRQVQPPSCVCLMTRSPGILP